LLNEGYVKMLIERIALMGLPASETERVKQSCGVEK